MSAHSSVPTKKVGAILAVLMFAALIASCTAPASPTSLPTDASTPEPTAEVTEEPIAAAGKLLDPCALILPSEIEALIGQPILSDYRNSSWITYDFSYVYSSGSIESATIGLYQCNLLDYNSSGTQVSVYVHKDAETAQIILREGVKAWNAALEALGLEMVEESGIGDLAFRPSTPSAEAVVPDLAYTFGNYKVVINLQPTTGYPFEKVLEFGNLILSRLPADVHSVLPDENLSLETNQPKGKLLEPCAIVTLDEARALTAGIFDAPITQEKSDSQWGIGDYDTYYCTYYSPSDIFSSGIPGLEIWTWRYKNLNDYYSYLEGITLDEVEGLGDQAFTNSPLYQDADITVVSGNFVIDIDFHDTSVGLEAQYDAAVEVAKTALSHLPGAK